MAKLTKRDVFLYHLGVADNELANDIEAAVEGGDSNVVYWLDVLAPGLPVDFLEFPESNIDLESDEFRCRSLAMFRNGERSLGGTDLPADSSAGARQETLRETNEIS